MSWPFAGRDALLDRVAGLLAGGASVVLVGAAGIGKSRLAAEAETETSARSTGRLSVHRVVASPAAVPLPLAPFAALIGDAVGTAAVHAIVAGLTRLPGRPLLVVDDLHLLDDASATVVHQLVTAHDVVLLATLRTGAPVTEPVLRIREAPPVRPVAVGRLDDEAVASIIEQRLGGPLDARSRRRIVALADGTMLFAREMVEGSLDAGLLTRSGAVWTLAGETASTPLLEELVLARLAPLDGEALRVMEALAVGGPLDLGLLRRLVSDQTIEQMERTGLLRSIEASDGTVTIDVAHPLHREVLRLRLGSVARTRIHGALADAAGPPSAAVTASEHLRTTVWHHRSGQRPDADDLLQAARHAQAMGDPSLAADLGGAAFAAGGGTASAFLVSWCLGEVGRHDDAIAVLRTARTAARSPWDRAAIRLRISEELWWTARLDAATQELDDAAADGEGPWSALLTAQRAVTAVLDGDLDAAHALAAPLADHAHLWVRFVAGIAVALVALHRDDTDLALTVSGAVVAATAGREAELLGDASLHLAIQLIALTHAGEIATAAALADAAHRDTSALPSVLMRAWAALLAGQAAAFAGRAADAVRLLGESEHLWASSHLDGFASWCAAGLARAQVEAGDPGAGAETVRRLDRYDRRGFGLYQAVVDIARCWVAAADGDRRAAAASVRAALAHATARGQAVFVAWAWHDAARLDLLDLVGDPTSSLAPTGRLTRARWDVAIGRATADADLLDDASVRLAACGANLWAAEAAALSAGALRRSRDTRRAARLEARVAELLAPCGPVHSPCLPMRTAGPLTAREHEIAVLVATGLSNRAIAQRLVVSERTVENHLYRMFTKLDVTSRTEVAAKLMALHQAPSS